MKRISAVPAQPHVAEQVSHAGERLLPINRADVVIVGNGIAGLLAAREALRVDPHLHLALVTRRNHPTIYTPALRHFLMGRLGREQLVAVPPDMERIQNLSVIQGSAERITASNSRLVLHGGQSISYGKLLLATGSCPRGMPPALAGRDLDGVVNAHHLTDYLDLRRRLAEAEQIVVVGGGIHGLETVLSLLHHHLPVSWLIRSKTCLPRYLDEEGSEVVIDRVRAAGAKVEVGSEVVEVQGRVGAVSGVVTSNGQALPCDLVIACTGVEPDITLASHCDKPLRYQKGRGILVDDWLQTGVAAIYAAGDVAAIKDPRTGIYTAHPHWAEASRQGILAGELLGGRDLTEHSPAKTSWHTTTLGGRYSLLAVGDTLGSTPGAEHWTERRRGTYRRITTLHDQVIGYVSINEHMPDPAAITYVIDEGLSLSAIHEVLLGRRVGNSEGTPGRTTPLLTARTPVDSSADAATSEYTRRQEPGIPGTHEQDARRKLS